MKIRYTLWLLMFTLVSGMPLGSVHGNTIKAKEKEFRKERAEAGQRWIINEEDIKPGKKGMQMDGLSLAAHTATMAGLASFFLLPPMALLLLPAGFIMGMIAWRSKKRYANRRGKGLALGAVAVGGAFTLAVVISLAAFLLTFGIY